MPQEPKPIRHLSSNIPIVYFSQALIVVTIVFVVAFVLYAAIFKTVPGRVVSTGGIPTAMIESAIRENGIDETQLYEQPDVSIPKEKINNLFPQIK